MRCAVMGTSLGVLGARPSTVNAESYDIRWSGMFVVIPAAFTPGSEPTAVSSAFAASLRR